MQDQAETDQHLLNIITSQEKLLQAQGKQLQLLQAQLQKEHQGMLYMLKVMQDLRKEHQGMLKLLQSLASQVNYMHNKLSESEAVSDAEANLSIDDDLDGPV